MIIIINIIIIIIIIIAAAVVVYIRKLSFLFISQLGAADAEIKVRSAENPERKCSPFKACSRSV